MIERHRMTRDHKIKGPKLACKITFSTYYVLNKLPESVTSHISTLYCSYSMKCDEITVSNSFNVCFVQSRSARLQSA